MSEEKLQSTNSEANKDACKDKKLLTEKELDMVTGGRQRPTTPDSSLYPNEQSAKFSQRN